MAAGAEPVQGRPHAGPITLPLPPATGARTSGVPPLLRLQTIRSSLGMKLGLLLTAILVVSLAALVVVQRMQQQGMADLLTAEVRERSSTMEQAIELTARGLRDFVSDYAQWDDMVRFVENPDRAWAAINLDASLSHFDLTAVWVMRLDGSVAYATRGENTPTPPALPLAATTVRTQFTTAGQGTFFVQQPDRLVELCVAPIQPSADIHRVSQPRGWVIAERTWDKNQIALLAKLINCEGRITLPGRPLPRALPNEITLRHPLRGPDGVDVAEYVYTIRSAELEITSRHNRSTVFVLGGSGLLMGAIAIGALFRWVLRPLGAIGHSLAHNDPAPIGSLTLKKDEMGRLARLVETSFAQRAELERNIAERTRLGRDLHDGAIQTVYAAGMTLAGVRTSVRSNPDEAERAIDDIRAALNVTIRDLREFIGGLESEPGHHTRFGEAVRAIVTLMQGVRPMGFTLQIDDALAERLSDRVRLHLLQIIRECASNCVRHSQARNMEIVLRQEPDHAVLDILDDGEGIAAAPSNSQGRGLANLGERTRELGGVLRLESTPGKGLRLHLTFPCAASGGG